MGRADFSDQFRKMIIRHKRIGYYLKVMQQSACLVINPNAVVNFAALFDCTPVDRVLDSQMAPTLSYSFSFDGTVSFSSLLGPMGLNFDLLLLHISSRVAWRDQGSQTVRQHVVSVVSVLVYASS